MRRLKDFIVLSKPRLVYLLFFTALASMIIAGSIYGYDWKATALLSVAIILGVMGSNAMTNFVDRGIDNMMDRTRMRPIPAGRIRPRQALAYSMVMVTAAVALAMYVNIWSGILIMAGFVDSAVIYNLLTKKKTPASILLGAPAGGMPVLAGWAGIAGGLELLPVLLFLLIMIWTPIHIWSLAYFYREDYRRAGIPMLPVVMKNRMMFAILALLNTLMVGFSIYIGVLYSLSLLYMLGSACFGTVILALSLYLAAAGKDRTAWLLFKLTSPYLAFIFVVLVVEYVFIS